MTNEKLRSAAIDAVAHYMGIAAEFVVDDAFEEASKSPAFASKPQLQEMVFLICLGKLLPPEVPFVKVKAAIIKAAALKPQP